MAGQLRGALVDHAVNVAASVALFAVLYVAMRPEFRRDLTAAAAEGLRRVSGADRRAWIRSPKAEFARRRRDLFIAQEWSAAPLEAITP